jgi:hypothetical protein
MMAWIIFRDGLIFPGNTSCGGPSRRISMLPIEQADTISSIMASRTLDLLRSSQ